MFCPNCGSPVPDEAIFCANCGTKLISATANSENADNDVPVSKSSNREETVSGNAADQARKFEHTEEPFDSSNRDIHTIVQKHCEYYLPEFVKAETKEKTKFKWAAFLLGPIFCFYRKCGELFKKYFLLPYIILGIGFICAIIGSSIFSIGTLIAAMVSALVYFVWLLVSSILFAKNFNKDYYEHCKKELNSSTPNCGTSVGAAIGVAAIYVAIVAVIMVLSLGAGILGGNRELDDFDYDTYYEDFYEEFGDGSDISDHDNSYGYAAESIYQPMMSDAVSYSMNGGSEAETPRLVIGQIDGEEYGVFYAWNYEAEMPVIVLEGQSEWAGNGYYRLYDSYHDGYLEYCLSGDESRCVIDVTQYGKIGNLSGDYSGEYMDVNGYMEYYYG